MPDRLQPIVCVLLSGLLLAVGVVAHVTRNIDDKAHRHQHMSIKPQPPHGWQVAIEENGKVTYLRDHKRTYATQREYQKMMARK